MISHYLDLLRLYWKSILACAAGAALLAHVASSLLLAASPAYKATIAVTMQPSDEELSFNRAFMGVSQFNPATIIAQSHIERLLSRPVAERALDMLLAARGDEMSVEEPTRFALLRAAFWRTWNTLNYGYHVPPTPREQFLSDIRSALEIEIVEGSYILSISFTYDDPVIAAEAANAIAQAYTEEARADFLLTAEEVAQTIGEQQAGTVALLTEKFAERERAARLLGVNDVTTERTVALEARQAARTELREAEIELQGERASLAELRASAARQSDVEILREMNQIVALGEANLDRLTESVRLRRASLLEFEASLDSLQNAEQELAEIDIAITSAEVELDELQRRRLALDLATKARLSQIRVINPAIEPVYPYFPKVFVNTIVAAIVGGVLAVAPIFATDVLGNRVRTYFDLQQIVGARALPTVSLLLRARRRSSGWPVRGFAAVIGRRIAAACGGWPSTPILVTGYLDERRIETLTELLSTVTAIAGPADAQAPALDVLALAPISKVPDWSGLRERVVVFGIAAGEIERDEVEGLLRRAEAVGAVPFFVLWI